MEVLATVLLLTVLGLALVSGAGAGLRLVRRAFTTTLTVVRLAQADRWLRAAAARVRTPYWEAGPAVDSGPGWLAVGWVDGEPGGTLRLESRDGLLLARALGGPPAAFGPFAGLDLDLYRDAGGRPAGVRVSLSPEVRPGEAPMVILAPFGGRPIYREGGR
jgi:hypothetical protein